MTSSTITGETGSQTVEDLARRHPGLVMLGRLGWVAKGLVYGVVGLLAVQIALDALFCGHLGAPPAAQERGLTILPRRLREPRTTSQPTPTGRLVPWGCVELAGFVRRERRPARRASKERRETSG